MNHYYFAVVTQGDLYTSSEGNGVPIAEVVFSPGTTSAGDTSFVFGALRTLDIGQRGSNMLELSNETQLAVFPSTLTEDKPDWSDAGNSLWIFRRLPISA